MIIKDDNNEIILRAVELEDKILLKELINNPEIEKMVLGWSFPVSDTQQIDWINNLKNDKNDIKLIIDVKHIGAVGIVSLTNIDFKNSTATINIKLQNKKEIRGQGIGYRAVKMLIDYSFNQLNLNCLIANILKYNTPSQNLFEKCEFIYEGTLYNRIYKEGLYQDVYSYSLSKNRSKIK